MSRKANKMSTALPSLGKPALPEKSDEVIASFKTQPAMEDTLEQVTIVAPTLSWDTGYVRKKLDVALNGTQAQTLKGIQLGLEKQEAQLANGRYVANPVDAIRWLLEHAN